MTDDDAWNLMIFICILCVGMGFWMGNFAASFSIPTMKIWESNRTYDHILLADTVMCNPANATNVSYYAYEVVSFNQTDYIYKKWAIDNTSAKRIVICNDT